MCKSDVCLHFLSKNMMFLAKTKKRYEKIGSENIAYLY